MNRPSRRRTATAISRKQNGKLVLPGIELGEDEDKAGLLLGIVRYTAIGGNVWIDRGGSVETLGGAQISLKDDSGNVLRTLTTGENGAFRFDKLMPGTYQLDAVAPEGCVIIEPGDRRLNGEQVSVMTDTVNREGSSDPINLKMAQDQLKMNIGCVLPGRMGDFCWLDLDGDGLQGMDEPGIPGCEDHPDAGRKCCGRNRYRSVWLLPLQRSVSRGLHPAGHAPAGSETDKAADRYPDDRLRAGGKRRDYL